MKYTESQLKAAVSRGIFTEEQVHQFKEYVTDTSSQTSGLINILYYGGGLLIISALTWLMKSSWDSFGAQGIVLFSTLYLLTFSIAGYVVFFKKKMATAGGILFSIVIAIIPLLVFGIMQLLNFWPQGTAYGDYYVWIKGKWVILEISTLLVGIVILWITRFPFHMFLIAFTFWFFFNGYCTGNIRK